MRQARCPLRYSRKPDGALQRGGDPPADATGLGALNPILRAPESTEQRRLQHDVLRTNLVQERIALQGVRHTYQTFVERG